MQLGLQFLEPPGDLLGKLVGVGILLVLPVELRAQLLVSDLLLSADFGNSATKMAQSVGMAVGEFERNLDPFPALGAEGFGLGGELLNRQAVEQRRVPQPAAIVLLEQVAHHDAARFLVGGDADELRPLCPKRGSRSRSAGGG